MPINSFLYPSKNVPGPYEIANSCRFNGADSAYFSKTPSSNGSQTISTFSAWIKKAVNGSYEGIFTSVYETGEYFEINFEPSDKLEIRSKYSNSYVLRKQTTRVFRDLSSWMHIVVVLDTTDGTAEDRCKVYINGVRETSFSTNTNPGSSQNLGLNATSYEHRVGRDEWSTPAYFDGYMAEVHWIDGTAKAHTDFGEFDSDSPTIWIPKEYTDGGYGMYHTITNMDQQFAERSDGDRISPHMFTGESHSTIETAYHSTSYPALIPAMYNTHLFTTQVEGGRGTIEEAAKQS